MKRQKHDHPISSHPGAVLLKKSDRILQHEKDSRKQFLKRATRSSPIPESFFKTLKTEEVYLMDAGAFDELSVGGSCSI
jgi:hypothetical protein